MSGAAVSVDPVTATLPEVPVSVHSGVPPFAGAAVGHVAAAAGVSVTEDVTTSATEGVLVDEVSVPEPHAASVMRSDAAPATSATEEGTREKFTVVTLQPRHAVLADSPAMSVMDPSGTTSPVAANTVWWSPMIPPCWPLRPEIDGQVFYPAQQGAVVQGRFAGESKLGKAFE